MKGVDGRNLTADDRISKIAKVMEGLIAESACQSGGPNFSWGELEFFERGIFGSEPVS